LPSPRNRRSIPGMHEQPPPTYGRKIGTLTHPATSGQRRQVCRWRQAVGQMKWPHPLIIAAYLGTVASLAASALAVSTGSLWLAALAVLLVGTASLVPDFLAYRQTRKMLAEARRQPARPQTAAWPVSEQAIELPESFSQGKRPVLPAPGAGHAPRFEWHATPPTSREFPGLSSS
jgi:hypothetical protein